VICSSISSRIERLTVKLFFSLLIWNQKFGRNSKTIKTNIFFYIYILSTPKKYPVAVYIPDKEKSFIEMN